MVIAALAAFAALVIAWIIAPSGSSPSAATGVASDAEPTPASA